MAVPAEAGPAKEQTQGEGFPLEFLSLGENLIVDLKPRRTPFLLGPLTNISLLGFLTGFVIFGTVLSSSKNPLVALIALGALGIFFASFIAVGIVVGYLRWKNAFYGVTDRRVIAVSGIIGRSSVDVTHDKIQNVTLIQNAFQQWRGYGSIIFASAGIGGGMGGESAILGNVVFRGVANPVEVRRRIEDIVVSSAARMKARDYREMAETFREVGAEAMPGRREVPTIVVQPTESRPAKFCEFCGAPVEGRPKFCEKCGNRIN